MTIMPEPSLLTLLKRSFWGLFGAIWLVVGVLFLVIGIANVIRGPMRGGDAGMGMVMGGAGVLIGAVGGVLLRKGLKSAQVEQRLLREGLTAQATVVEVRMTHIRFNGRYQWVIDYEYEDRLGERRSGHSGYLDQDEALEWQAGGTGLIRFDPRDSRVSVWVGRV
jgi:uncharacterized protein DUF3592